MGYYREDQPLPPLPPLTIKRVRDRVDGIRAAAVDPEFAHSEEDALYRDVLIAIMNGAPDAPDMAAAALTSRLIKFDRWTA